MTPSLRPLSSVLGVEVVGIDLSKAIRPETFKAVYRAWIDATVLLFRHQTLSESDQLAFVKSFGPIKSYNTAGNEHPEFPEILVFSNLKKNGRSLGAASSGRYWHTDGHFLREPPSASALYALQVPPAGGNTLFCNMFAAYDALPTQLQERISGLKIIVSRSKSQQQHYPDRKPMSDEERAAWPDMRQPLVRTHPITGRKALYLGGEVPWTIEDMPMEDSAPLLAELCHFAIQPKNIYVHAWRAGDLVIWDNRSVIHKATPYDEITSVRHMHRITVQGDLPY